MKPTFHVKQNSSLLDSTIEIRITNLRPCEVVTLKAEMCDNLGTSWESFVELMSDNEGLINVATARPLSGTYLSPDVTGLFWSMSPILTDKPKSRTPLKPLETKLILIREHEVVAVTTIIREVISPNVNRFSLREQGLVGTFFSHPNGEPLPTIIVLGGSEGGLRESNAALLASYGYNTLALAYFGIEDLPKELVNIPLEYIEKAIGWLNDHPNVDITKLGVLGTSKGGELALVCASLFPAIKAVVAYVPSGVVYPGIGQSARGVSSWQFKGEPLPFANGEVPKKVSMDINHARDIGEPIAWRETYRYWAEGEKKAEIAVENIHGPILLISGGDDQLWPADVLSEKVISRLREHNHTYSYEHINYPKAGHAFGVPGLPTTQSVMSPFGNGKLLLGGTPQDNSHAQFDAWERVKDFFDTHLNTSPD